jgi:hypothetical protein
VDSTADPENSALECAMQGLRRTLAKYFSIFHGKAAWFDETERCRNFRYRHASAICSQEGAPCFGQPQHSKTPARRKTVDFVKCLAKRPLAYLKRMTQGRNVQRLVDMGESQSLSLLDEIGARVAFPGERRFRHGCEPLMNVHRSTCTHENDLAGAT